MWVFDATPLIYLAKTERLEAAVGSLDEPCAMPREVYEEVVVVGMDAGYPDARRVEQCVEKDLFEVIETNDGPLEAKLSDNDSLSDADVAVLARASENDGIAVMDEQYGRNVASVEGIRTRGTAFLVLRLLEEGAIDGDEARETIDAMIDAGWYCSPRAYTKIIGKIESLER
jgi:predicted nucleic acid-binding protein